MPTHYDPKNTFYIVIYGIPLMVSIFRALANVVAYRFDSPIDYLQKGNVILVFNKIINRLKKH